MTSNESPKNSVKKQQNENSNLNPNSSNSKQTKNTSLNNSNNVEIEQKVNENENINSKALDTPCTKELWLIRHGERIDLSLKYSAWIRSTPKIRHFDPPLTDKGRKQAFERGQKMENDLKELKNRNEILKIPTCIYTSPLDGCINTAVEIAKTLKLPIIVSISLT